MPTLDQPPPDLPAPPPGREARRSRAYLRNIILLGSFCALPVFLFGYVLLKPRHRGADLPEALNNIRQISISLLDFDAEFGCFPDSTTIPAVKAYSSTSLTLDDSSSNKLFRQLIAYELKSERPFWCKTKTTPNKPDNIFMSDATALRPGECGFAYIAGLKSSDPLETPVVMAPLEKGKTTFDRKPYRGRAIILFLDMDAKPLPIEKDGRVLINGMDIFDPRQPFWKGKAPDIKWQE
ncbi:hypothetical protein [Luteolibacter luteus]|uniref:Uncharacterized protein n=1 Tax=Luteolibacter luteus TaxID=2728835 RepID=A0A858RGY1_9BACT|nr:hypothetical protein [Luteolibacter luteus]QJE95778.1 hypothetical protein HHL09_08260 [Luteolibacter luteus]